MFLLSGFLRWVGGYKLENSKIKIKNGNVENTKSLLDKYEIFSTTFKKNTFNSYEIKHYIFF